VYHQRKRPFAYPHQRKRPAARCSTNASVPRWYGTADRPTKPSRGGTGPLTGQRNRPAVVRDRSPTNETVPRCLGRRTGLTQPVSTSLGRSRSHSLVRLRAPERPGAGHTSRTIPRAPRSWGRRTGIDTTRVNLARRGGSRSHGLVRLRAPGRRGSGHTSRTIPRAPRSWGRRTGLTQPGSTSLGGGSRSHGLVRLRAPECPGTGHTSRTIPRAPRSWGRRTGLTQPGSTSLGAVEAGLMVWCDFGRRNARERATRVVPLREHPLLRAVWYELSPATRTRVRAWRSPEGGVVRVVTRHPPPAHRHRPPSTPRPGTSAAVLYRTQRGVRNPGRRGIRDRLPAYFAPQEKDSSIL